MLYGIKITWISRWGQEEGAREDTVDVGRRRQHKYLGVMMARSSSSVCLGSGCLHLATSGFLEAKSPGIRVAVSLLPKGPEQGEWDANWDLSGLAFSKATASTPRSRTRNHSL